MASYCIVVENSGMVGEQDVGVQLDMFGACRLVVDIREAVRTGGPHPVKTCLCKEPCWWHKGGAKR